jgi:methionyl-tRNA formyltransferase
MRPSTPSEPDLLDAVGTLMTDLPPGMDLLLPGGTGNLRSMLTGYDPDVLLVYGFNWRLPREVLELPRFGVLNVHPSALPKYRGPSPVLWAIRNGDRYMGITVHRMTTRIDAGPILAQVDDIPIPDEVTNQAVWELTKGALPDLIETALDRAVRGDQGTLQNEAHTTYAGFPPPDWYTVTWQGSRLSLHNQIRVLRFMARGSGPTVEFQGQMVQIERSSLTPDGGIRIECEDGPLWVTSTPAGSG